MTIPANTVTGLPTLVKILLAVCGFINRNRARLLAYLPPDSEILLDAVLVACVALEEVAAAQLPPD